MCPWSLHRCCSPTGWPSSPAGEQGSAAASPAVSPPSAPRWRSGNATPRRRWPPRQEVGGLGLTTDVRDSAEVDAALARTTAELGPVSILVNNAGGVFLSPILETSENGWDALYRANLKHVILCTQRVARTMVENGTGGSIISVTSIEGVRAAPGYAAYAAAKAGVINFTKTAALELAPYGIRVNALAPDITLDRGHGVGGAPRSRGQLRPHGAHGTPRPRRRDGRRRRLPGRLAVELRHRSDHPCRRRDPGVERLVPPSRDRLLRPRADLMSVGPTHRSSCPADPTWADMPPSMAIICPVM